MICMPAHSSIDCNSFLVQQNAQASHCCTLPCTMSHVRQCSASISSSSTSSSFSSLSSFHLHLLLLVQMRESEKRKGSKRKGHMDDDTERHAMPGARKPAKQSRR